MKTLISTAASFMIIFGLSNANAARVDRHQRHQESRIRQGVRNGQLNKEEAKKLRMEQREIRKEKREMRADGHLDRKERKELRKEQREASKDIYKEKHDND